MTIARALLLVGSAKTPGTSTSEALGRYLLDRLAAGGAATVVVPVCRSTSAVEDRRLAAAVAGSDLFILATPLYVDSLPYLVTRALESLAVARSREQTRRRCAFVALMNCGFPESRQCETALAILRLFARQAGFDWAGGLALGGGETIAGRSLDQLGGMTRNVRTALDIAASALLTGGPVPPDAIKRLARPLMPSLVYTFMGNAGWKRQARRNGVRGQLGARPFAD